ncbi:MAG: electron transfer flavoprotein subunit alpha/FixB family protein [Desulforhopalus sp.]
MEQFGNTIITLIEPVEGRLDDTAKGMLAYSARLASQLCCPWQAIAVREPAAKAVEEAGRFGTRTITFAKPVWEYSERPEQTAYILSQLLISMQQPVVLLPHNDLGTTLAPILAAKLDAAIVSEVREIERVEEGLSLSQSIVGTKIIEKRIWQNRRPLVLTLPLETLSSVEVVPAQQCDTGIEMWEMEVNSDLPSTEIIQRIPPDPTTVDLSEAETIFCAGKGCNEENIRQLRELCDLLGLSFGVTRPVFDLGWCDFSRMIGQTGRTVKPKTYVSFGVSGSMHHVGGIKDSGKIIAVNIDAKAPIFPNADEGFVADVDEVLPIMLESVKNMPGGER